MVIRSPHMRTCVIGCGSIGTRRANLLDDMGHAIETIDPDRELHAASLGRLTTIGELCQRHVLPDAVFICTPAETHVPLALAVLNHARAVFIEKPLATSTDGMEELRRAAIGKTVMVACNLRFAYGQGRTFPRATDGHLRLVQHKPLSQWRRGAEAYRKHGIVLEAAIHELDLASAWQGRITTMAAAGHDDHVILTCEHEGGRTSEIDVNWAENAATRRFAECGGTKFEPDLSDEMYRMEMAHFLDCVRMHRTPCNTIGDAEHVLEWALRAREAGTV